MIKHFLSLLPKKIDGFLDFLSHLSFSKVKVVEDLSDMEKFYVSWEFFVFKVILRLFK